MSRRRACAATASYRERKNIMLGWFLIILLVILLIGALPTWPYSSGWGYYPTGIVALLLAIVLILLLFGFFPFGRMAPGGAPT